MNILLTCAGRRNYLITYFKKALNGTGLVMTTDASADAPAMQEADRAFVVPRVDTPNYTESLLDICRRESVGLLASVNDLELPVLCREHQKFAAVGTRLAVSDAQVIDIAFDKWRTLEFLSSINLKGPDTALTLTDARKKLDIGIFQFPLVVKPRWGTASMSIEIVHDLHELELAFELTHLRLKKTFLAQISATDSVRSVMIQECLRGDEYGLDIVNDLHGRHAVTFVKKKLSMRAGETDRAIIVDNRELADLGHEIGRRLGHVGNLDCDVFLTPDGPRVLELNPRFGGGYPFSHEAGANIPAALVAWARGESPDPAWLKVEPGVCFSKCDRLVRKIL